MRNNTVYLSKKEQAELNENKILTVERNVRIPAPKCSILHGIGYGRLFDKVDYCWVYGDVINYIQSKTNKGRRATDYPDNKPNTTNGGLWWSNIDLEDEYGSVGTIMYNGLKKVIKFKVTDIVISELKPKGEYLTIVLKISLQLKEK